MGARGRRRKVRLLLLVVMVVVLSMVPMAPSFAADFVVDSTADVGDANPGDGVCDDGAGNCTLRAAVEEANALAGADTITLAAETYSINGAVLDHLDITDDLTISGAGIALTKVESFNTGDEAFHIIAGGITVTIQDLTLDTGDWNCLFIGPDGGSTLTVDTVDFNDCGSSNAGIRTATDGTADIVVIDSTFTGAKYGVIMESDGGSLTMSNSSVTGATGAALFLDFQDGNGTVSITDSTFNDNDDGVEVYVNDGFSVDVDFIRSETRLNDGWGARFEGDVDIIDSWFSDNNGDGFRWEGPGSLLVDGTTSDTNTDNGADIRPISDESINIVNSTFSGNDEYGLLTDRGTNSIVNSTFVDNYYGLGLFGATELLNTIIYGSTAGDCDIDAVVTSLGGNIDGDNTCNFDQSSDQPNTNPLLGALADNGGLTRTHLPGNGSPAVDNQGQSAGCPDTDQRGVIRIQGSECDSGSVEVEQEPSVTTTTLASTTTTLASTTTVAATSSTLPATGLGDGVSGVGVGGVAILITGLALIVLATIRTRQQES